MPTGIFAGGWGVCYLETLWVREGICIKLVWSYVAILLSVTHLVFKLIVSLGFTKSKVIDFGHSSCAS